MEEIELSKLQRQCLKYRKLAIGFGSLAVIAPLLGIIGTVIGMIQAFDTMGVKGGSDPSELAGNMSLALITTATGLAVSFPSVILCIVFLIVYLKKKHRLGLYTPPPSAQQGQIDK